MHKLVSVLFGRNGDIVVSFIFCYLNTSQSKRTAADGTTVLLIIALFTKAAGAVIKAFLQPPTHKITTTTKEKSTGSKKLLI